MELLIDFIGLHNNTYIWPRSWPTFYPSHIGLKNHSGMQPARILIHGTLMQPVKTWLGFAHWLPWPIFDLGHDLLSISQIVFWTLMKQLGSCYLAHWFILSRPCMGLLTDFLDLYFDLSRDLLSCGHIGFWTLITLVSRLSFLNGTC